MSEFFESYGTWLVTGALFCFGLVGCLLPVIPGHLLILAGVIIYRLMDGASAGIGWWTYVILIFLMVVSQAFEILSGSLGAKWFGGSKWGAWGALVGGIVGLFFFPLGLLLGPLAGAVGFEMAFAKKKPEESMASGVGSMIGTLAGMVFKLAIGLVMIAWFFIDVFWLG